MVRSERRAYGPSWATSNQRILTESLVWQGSFVALVSTGLNRPFVAGGTHLPAGHYHVYHPGDPYFIVLEKDDGRARAMVYVHPSATDPSESGTKLVFNKYGEQHFLSQVWSENDPQMHHCSKGRMEQQLMAQSSKPQLVIVAAK